jgi:3-(3-hydroxy-phenyl)propionate hydroxylase
MNTQIKITNRGEPFDVAIVGAGPTGVSLANLLGSYGLSVCLLDRNVGVLQIPRAIHFDGETMRVFQSLGLASNLMPILRPGGGMHWVNAQGKTLLVRKGVDGLGEHGWHNDYYYHQPAVEAILREGLMRYAHVNLHEGVELTEVRQDAEGVELLVRMLDTQTSERIQARYVVGCDGARSKIREYVGGDREFEDLGEHQAWLVVDGVLNHPLNLPEHTIQHCDPSRPATSIYVSPLRRRWELMLLPGEDPKDMVAPEKVWELVAPWVKPSQATLERASTYVFHSLVAQRWQDGRILMAGDAAHQTPPFLGQGLCAAIRDVSNLAWKLAFALRNPEQGPAVLATYGPERIPHARAFIALAVDVGRVIQELDVAKAVERDNRLILEGVSFSFPSPQLGTGLHLATTEESPIGKVAPQFELSDGRWTDDVAGPRWSILVDAANLSSLPARVREMAKAADIEIIETPSITLSRWLLDFGAVAAVLRPDRYVYTVCLAADALTEVLKTLLPLLAEKS